MRSRLRARSAGASFLPWLIFACLGCGKTPLDDVTPPCTPTTAPVFLTSKLDDDDGDGRTDDENHPAVDDEDDDIADHAWIQDRYGAYHLFFQNEDRGVGSDIEHYVTTDLQELAYVGAALQKSPGSWDSHALWAPHIVQRGNIYFMFYTGTTGTGRDAVQRIGLATSTGLDTWTRYPVNRCPGTSGDGCIYECAEPWTTWGGPPGAYNQQCRDAFVIRDEVHRRWVLFATAKSTNGFGVVTVAYSQELTRWTGAGYLDATRRLADGTGGQPTGGQAENPFVVSYHGTYYLLFTDWEDSEDNCTVQNPRTMVQYVTSSTLAADASGSRAWRYRGYTPDPGVNAIEGLHLGGDTWILSQSIIDRTSCDYDEHRRELRLKQVIWGPNATFDTAPWSPCIGDPAPPLNGAHPGDAPTLHSRTLPQ